MEIPDKYQAILLEALEDLMYKISLELTPMKGLPLTKERKILTKKQSDTEDLQHLVSSSIPLKN
jgi:hypothetical protein